MKNIDTKFKPGEEHWNWKGGRYLTKKGYYRSFVPEGHPSHGHAKEMFEHKIVMEKHLGRRLRSQEVVHHKNGVRTDNRIDNLEVMSRRAHSRLHALDSKSPEHVKNRRSKETKGVINQKENHPQYKNHVTKEKIEYLEGLGLARGKIAWVLDMSPDGLRYRMKEYGIYTPRRKK